MQFAIYDADQLQLEKLVEQIRNWLSINKNIGIINAFTDSQKLLLHCSYYGEPDIVFYHLGENVKLKTNNLLLLRKVCPNTELVIVSSNIRLAISGYRVNATRFLEIPLYRYQIFEALEQCSKNTKAKQKTKFVINTAGESLAVPYKEIEYFESVKHYVIAITGQRSIRFRENIGTLDILLPKTMFVRCHKCYIVNLFHIDKVTSTGILLLSDKEIPMSRNYRDSICRAFDLYSQALDLSEKE